MHFKASWRSLYTGGGGGLIIITVDRPITGRRGSWRGGITSRRLRSLAYGQGALGVGDGRKEVRTIFLNNMMTKWVIFTLV